MARQYKSPKSRERFHKKRTKKMKEINNTENTETPVPTKSNGYRFNPLPNRAQRRAAAREYNRNAWKKSNEQWNSTMNYQTVVNSKLPKGLTIDDSEEEAISTDKSE